MASGGSPDMPVRFQVEADFYDHPKTAGMSDAAFSLWVRAGSYCVAKLTDGFVTEQVLEHALRSSKDVAQELVARGLWRKVRGGYAYHQWDGRNLTRERVEEYRARDANRKREKRNEEKSQVDETTSEECPSGHLSDSERNPPAVCVGVSVSKKNSEPDGFADFYDAFPLKKARGAAVKAYTKAVKEGADPSTLVLAAKRYAHSPDRNPKYTKYPATWLNQKCWLDEDAPSLPMNEWAGLR